MFAITQPTLGCSSKLRLESSLLAATPRPLRLAAAAGAGFLGALLSRDAQSARLGAAVGALGAPRDARAWNGRIHHGDAAGGNEQRGYASADARGAGLFRRSRADAERTSAANVDGDKDDAVMLFTRRRFRILG